MYLTGADEGLQREIDAFVAIDSHAHPQPLGAEPAGVAESPIQPYEFELPKRMRPYNPEYLDAWSALWGYEHRDFEPGHLANLMETKASVMASHGSAYNPWVLDRLNLKSMVNINADIQETLPMARFPWCMHAEWMLWPFLCDPMPDGPSRRLFDTMVRKLKQFDREDVPGTVDAYLEQIVFPALRNGKESGAIGIKFNTPYSRDLSFGSYDRADIEPLYAKGRRGRKQGTLSPSEHKAIQDYVFRAIALEAGRLDLAVQMHTGIGAKRQFRVSGSNPLLMETVFREASQTRFLLLHGGWPFVTETVTLTSYANVYTDFSCADLFQYPRSLSNQIRQALEWFPEKLMYGTDAYSDVAFGMLSGVPVKANPLHGWEEKAWMMDRTGRQALGLALSGMLADGHISGREAEAYVGMVMRGTVKEFHRLDE